MSSDVRDLVAGQSPTVGAALGVAAYGASLLPAGEALSFGLSQLSDDGRSLFWPWLIYAVPYMGSLLALAITKEPIMGFWTALPSALFDSVTVPLIFVAVQSDGLAGVGFVMLLPVRVFVLLPLGVYLGYRRYMQVEPER